MMDEDRSPQFRPSNIVLNFSFAFILVFIAAVLRRVISRIQYCCLGSSQKCFDALNELRILREEGLRDSERVVDLWNSKIRHSSQLGHERWTILEQVFIAALDVSDEELAWDCLEQLKTKFKKSSRVDRLFGMYLEKTGRFDDAHAVYTRLLNTDATNTLVRKRMIAILKAQRKNLEAIDELRQYLKIFMSDFDAWSELADLYLAEGDYKHAAFCMEELMLSNPYNHLYCQRYAEIKYTEGGSENFELARAYFARSCQLNPNNLRSLYGILLSCSALDHHLKPATLDCISIPRPKGSDMSIGSNLPPNLFSAVSPKAPLEAQDKMLSSFSKTEVNRELARWAGVRIRQIYENAALSPTDSPKRTSNTTICCENSTSPKQITKNSTPKSNQLDSKIASSIDTDQVLTKRSLDESHH